MENKRKNEKGKRAPWLLFLTFIMMQLLWMNPKIVSASNYDTTKYNPDDVAVINKIITENGLNAAIDNPESWNFVDWDIMGSGRIARLRLEDKGLQGVLDVSGLINLEDLNCYGNQLSSLDAGGLTNLTDLYCDGNQLSSLDIGGLTNLTDLYCDGNQLRNLDVGGLTNLTYLYCNGNQLSSLDVGGLTNLTDLSCDGNQLDSLDVGGLTNLTDLSCDGNQLSSLDVGGLTNLTDLSCNGNQLSKLDVGRLINLTYLSCDGNQLSSLDVRELTNLTQLSFDGNQLSSLDVGGLIKLTQLSCDRNQLSSLDVGGLTSLTKLSCSGNQLSVLTMPQGTLSFNGADGWLDISISVPTTGEIELWARPNAKFTFQSWTALPADAKVDGSMASFTMTGNQTVSASFVRQMPPIKSPDPDIPTPQPPAPTPKPDVPVPEPPTQTPETPTTKPETQVPTPQPPVQDPAPVVSAISLSPNSKTLPVGGMLTLQLAVTPENAVGQGVTYTSSDSRIAKVDGINGTVTAVAKGTAVITAKTDNGLTAECTIAVSKIELNAKSAVLRTGTSSTALKVVEAYPSDDRVASYKSSDKKIVSVDNKGKLSAKRKTGKAVVTVTTQSGAKASCVVTVQKGKVTTKSLSFDKKKLTLLKGKSEELTVTRNPITATEKISWGSSNKKVAKVDKNGKVSAIGEGSATITAKSQNGKKASCKIIVPGLTLKNDSAVIKVGKTVSIKIKSTVIKGDKVTSYKSANPKIASVDSRGVVTGVKKGKTSVTVITKNGAKATFSVTVK